MPGEELQLDFEHRDGVQIVRLIGRCTADNSQEVKDAVRNALADGKDRFVLDLGPCEFIDSAGLGSLVASRYSCAKKSASFVLCNVSTSVLAALRLARLDRILTICKSLESAIATALDPKSRC
jgi:anti-sigma B factor antagonist